MLEAPCPEVCLLPEQRKRFLGHKRKPQPSLEPLFLLRLYNRSSCISYVGEYISEQSCRDPFVNCGLCSHLNHFWSCWCHQPQNPVAANYRSYYLLGEEGLHFIRLKLTSYWGNCMPLNCLTAGFSEQWFPIQLTPSLFWKHRSYSTQPSSWRVAAFPVSPHRQLHHPLNCCIHPSLYFLQLLNLLLQMLKTELCREVKKWVQKCFIQQWNCTLSLGLSTLPYNVLWVCWLF